MPDKRQLVNSVNQALEFALSNLHTTTVARITVVNGDTIDCQPVINRRVNGEDVPLPVFVDVPPITLQGGTSYIKMPYAVGDYCLLFFTERCFDRWYEGDDFALPAEYRMHDYSDGFALVGVNNRAGAIGIPSVIELIGDMFAQGNHVHEGNVTQTGNYDLTGDMTINGNLTVNGDITCTGTLTVSSATIGGIDFGTHVHPENDNGGPTDPPQ